MQIAKSPLAMPTHQWGSRKSLLTPFIGIRSLPVRWQGRDIIVLDTVTVRGPGYGAHPGDVVGGEGSGGESGRGVVGRVRKVVSLQFPRALCRRQGREGRLILVTSQLEMERRKMTERRGENEVPNGGGGSRSGSVTPATGAGGRTQGVGRGERKGG